MSAAKDNAPPALARVHLVWYPLALLPILLLGGLGLVGIVPQILVLFAFFFFCFWLFSLGFALYERFVRKRRAVSFR
jgi:hypothetical protein